MKEDTRRQFGIALEEWRQHCSNPSVQVSSSIQNYINCDGYRKLVVMGPEILPLVRELYDPSYMAQRGIVKDTGLETLRDLGLVPLVAELVGQDFSLPEELRGKIEGMKKFTAGWLDLNMQRYS